jgi:MoaA/NifB/PqqE/SkfB family radical SAM enzyme
MDNYLPLWKELIYFLSLIVRPSPFYLIFFVTARCNSRCVTCFNPARTGYETHELKLAEIAKIVQKAPRLYQLTISGGEPTLRDDLPQIIALFKRHTGICHITITTNGLLPEKTVDILRQIDRLCPGLHIRLTVSLDGLGSVHDHIRGVPGSFAAVVETLHLLQNLRRQMPRLRLAINTVFCHYNQEHIEPLIDYVADNHQVENHLLLWVRGIPRDPLVSSVDLGRFIAAKKRIDSLYPQRENQGPISSVFWELDRMVCQIVIQTIKQKRAILPCRAGSKMIVIDEIGRVRPCEPSAYQSRNNHQIRENETSPRSPWLLGSLRESDYDLRSILNSSESKEKIRTIQKRGCHCTYECAIYSSVLSHLSSVARILLDCIRGNNR